MSASTQPGPEGRVVEGARLRLGMSLMQSASVADPPAHTPEDRRKRCGAHSRQETRPSREQVRGRATSLQSVHLGGARKRQRRLKGAAAWRACADVPCQSQYVGPPEQAHKYGRPDKAIPMSKSAIPLPETYEVLDPSAKLSVNASAICEQPSLQPSLQQPRAVEHASARVAAPPPHATMVPKRAVRHASTWLFSWRTSSPERTSARWVAFPAESGARRTRCVRDGWRTSEAALHTHGIAGQARARHTLKVR